MLKNVEVVKVKYCLVHHACYIINEQIYVYLTTASWEDLPHQLSWHNIKLQKLRSDDMGGQQ